MKYNIHINQKLIVDSGYNIDLEDACIIDFMYTFSLSTRIEKKIIGNKIYCWFQYDHIIKNLPLVKLKKDSIYRRIKAMIDIGLLETHPDNQKVGKSFFHVTEKVQAFYFVFEPTDENPNPYGNSSVPPTDRNPNYNNIIDNSSLSLDKEIINALNGKFEEHNPTPRKKALKKQSKPDLLMRDSIEINLDAVKFSFFGTMYEKANIEFYYEAALSWSNSKEKTSKDWLATIRNFMLRDMKDGKLVTGDLSQEQKLQGVEDLLKNFEDI